MLTTSAGGFPGLWLLDLEHREALEHRLQRATPGGGYPEPELPIATLDQRRPLARFPFEPQYALAARSLAAQSVDDASEPVGPVLWLGSCHKGTTTRSVKTGRIAGPCGGRQHC